MTELFETIEPFVNVEVVADFLDMPRPQVLRLTRRFVIRAYPICGKKRHVWKYRLSEVAEDIAGLRKQPQSTMGSGSPRSSAKGRKHAE